MFSSFRNRFAIPGAISVIALALLASATAAQADYQPAGTIGDAASLKYPSGVAVDEQTGNAYVGSLLAPGGAGFEDEGLVVEFSPAGEVNGALALDTAVTSVAFRQSDGHLYVQNNNGVGGLAGNAYISVYDRDGGEVVAPFLIEEKVNIGQIAVSEASGNVYSVDSFSNPGVFVNDAAGDALPSITGSGDNTIGSAQSVAVDAAGNVYVIDDFSNGGRLQKFNASGDFIEEITSGNSEVSVAINQSNGEIVLGAYAEPATQDGFHIIVLDANGDEVDDFGLGEFAPGELFGFYNSLTVDSTTGKVYAVDSSGQTVRVFSEPVPPTATTGAATSVSQTGAILTGEVNPNGWEVTDCTFDYEKASGGPSGSVECEQTVGDGNQPVGVTADVSGLDPNTAYEFELSATNEGGEDLGGQASFTTLPNQPGVSGATGTATGQNAATVKATIDANGGQASCVVQWGTSTAYGSEVPCNPATIGGDGGTAVSASLTGLAAGTTYHFRVLATNAGGSGQATGSFTTEAAPPPPSPSPPAAPSVIAPPPPADIGAPKAACMKKAKRAAKKSIKTANKRLKKALKKAKGKKAKAKARKAAAKTKKAANRKKTAAIKRCRA